MVIENTYIYIYFALLLMFALNTTALLDYLQQKHGYMPLLFCITWNYCAKQPCTQWNTILVV